MRARDAFYYLLLVTGCIVLNVGCAGHVIVEFDLEAQLSGRDATGKTWRAEPQEFISIRLHPKASTPFPPLQYQGKDFDWEFATNPRAFGGFVVNKTQGRLCFQFAEARLTSSMQADEIPIRASYFYHYIANTKTPIERREATFFSPPPVCHSPGERGYFLISPDLSALFPTGHMFNIRWPDFEASPVGKGVGQWVQLKLPVDIDGKREELLLKLTVRDSASRKSYF